MTPAVTSHIWTVEDIARLADWIEVAPCFEVRVVLPKPIAFNNNLALRSCRLTSLAGWGEESHGGNA